MSDFLSNHLDDIALSQAVYPDERRYYRPDVNNTDPETADEEDKTTSAYLRAKAGASALTDVEITEVED